MTPEEVIRAEGLTGTAQKINQKTDWVTYLEQFTEFNKKEAIIIYDFLDWKLEHLAYFMRNPNFNDYMFIREELWKKYGSWDITDELCKQWLAEASGRIHKIDAENLAPRERLAQLKEIQENLKNQKQKCTFMDDLTILSSRLKKDDIYLNEDRYVEWWDAVYHHTWQNPDLKTNIMFYAPKNDYATSTIIGITYSSQKYQDFEKKSTEENRDSIKNNL